jgi:hypothetical protein
VPVFILSSISGVRVFKSKYSVPKNIDKRISALKLKVSSSNAYIDFLNKYNVVVFDNEANIDYCIECEGESLPLEVILGFSKEDREDLLATNDGYLNRIPEDYFAVATLNYGDLLCLSPNGEVYYWDHEVNDLYFDMSVKGGYLEQNTNLKFVANSFDAFLSMIIKSEAEDDYDPDEDEYNNPNIPFPDETLGFWFVYPKVFFGLPKNMIAIYLKKLALSEKGREVLAKFKEEGLLG